jgi:hypothetical protein
MSHKWQLLFGEMGEGRDMFFGDDNYMGGCLRMDITEGNGTFILVKKFGGHFAGYNLAKDTIHFFLSQLLLV